MALAVGDRPVRPLTADEVLHMVRAGILDGDERIELLHGVLIEKSVQDPPHATVIARLTRWLAPVLVDGTHEVRVQLPFRVADRTSLPEPDVAVVARDDVIDHPSTAELLIEVAVTSLETDTVIKPPLYGAAGIDEIWVVDLRHRRLEIFGAERRTVESPARVAPLKLDVEPLDVAELFAGLP